MALICIPSFIYVNINLTLYSISIVGKYFINMYILIGKQLTGDFYSWMKLLCQHEGLRRRIVYWVFFVISWKVFSLSLIKCTPNDVRRFLVWKDFKGKTIVHKLCYPFLGSKSNFECNILLKTLSFRNRRVYYSAVDSNI